MSVIGEIAAESMEELTEQEMYLKMSRLHGWLATDAYAMEWARLKIEGTGPDTELAAAVKSIEKDRWDLTNRKLKKVMKAADATVPMDQETHEQMCQLALATLPFDRANALVCMKIVRNDPACPNGFLWSTESFLQNMPEQTKPRWMETKQEMASVSSAYEKLLVGLVGDAAIAYAIASYIEPMAPKWLNETYGMHLPTPARFLPGVGDAEDEAAAAAEAEAAASASG